MYKKLLLTILLLPACLLQAMQEDQSCSSSSNSTDTTTNKYYEAYAAALENGRNLFLAVRHHISQDATQEQKTALEALAFLQFMPNEVKQLISQSEPNNYKPMRELTGHTRYLTCVAIDSDMLVTGSADCTVRVYNRQTGELITELTRDSPVVICIAIDNDIMVIGTLDWLIRLYDIKTGEFLRQLKDTDYSLKSIALNDKVILVSSVHDYENIVSVYSKQTGACLQQIRGHRNNTHLPIITQGDYLIMGSAPLSALRL